MVLQLFGFVFEIIGSMLTFWIVDAKLDGSVTFGSLIIAVVVICFVISKLLGLARGELDDFEEDSYDGLKKEYSSHFQYVPKYSERGYIPRHVRGNYSPKHSDSQIDYSRKH